MTTRAAPIPLSTGVCLAGVPFTALDQPKVIDVIVSSAEAGRGGWLVNPNVDVLRQVAGSRSVRELVLGADVVVADGVPLLWAARLERRPLPGLVAGSDLIWGLTREATRRGVGVFLLGGAQGVAERASAVLEEHTGVPMAGYHCPPLGFEDDDHELDMIRKELHEARPGVVFCGLGFPKQERLMALLAPEFPATWFIGTGASISFVAGDTPRAPRWMRGKGLEWAHRLRSEPRRLFKRYIVQDAPYAARMLSSSTVRGLVAGRRRR